MIDRGSDRRIVDVLHPEYDDPKEPYAFFGLAAFWAQCFEQSLILIIVVLNIIKPSREKMTVDGIFAQLDKQTMGKLINELSQIMKIDESFGQNLKILLRKRNYLIHHFFSENSGKWYGAVSKRAMIDELREIAQMFQDGDRMLVAIYEPLWAKLGLDEEVTQREMEKLIAENQ